MVLVPEQTAVSMHPEPVLQSVFFAFNRFAGHGAEVPVHLASRSHVGEGRAALQTVVAGRNLFAGQDLDDPSHNSAGSHGPAEARHVTPLAAAFCAGQFGLEPVHVEAAVQAALFAFAHTELLGRNRPLLAWLVSQHAPLRHLHLGLAGTDVPTGSLKM